MIPDLTENASRRVFWPKVALVGSLEFYHRMFQLYEELGRNEIDALVPWPHYRDPESPTNYSSLFSGSEESLAIIRKQELETQLLRTKVSDLAYVVNPGVLVEDRDLVVVGEALQSGKAVYSMERITNGRFADRVLVKTPQEIIEMSKVLKETRYRPLLEEFRRHMNK